MNKLRKLPEINEKELIIVIRHRNAQGLSKNSKKILNSLNLKSANKAVFINMDKKLQEQLTLIKPFIVYGKPSLKSITTLIKTRAYCNSNGEVVPLKDNTIVEKELGNYGIICIDDIIHEISTIGPHFNEVTAFLTPFDMNKSTDKLEKNLLHKDNIGKGGFKGEKIDEIIELML